MSHVSELGWDACVFSDDALANKRILPGFCFKHISDKAWSERGRVTPASMTVMVRHMIGSSGPQLCSGTVVGSVEIGGIVVLATRPRFVRTPVALRKKADKNSWEWSAELSALAINVIKEARNLMPVDEAVLRQEFLEKFVLPPTSSERSADA